MLFRPSRFGWDELRCMSIVVVEEFMKLVVDAG
jgi:hypothetical protein